MYIVIIIQNCLRMVSIGGPNERIGDTAALPERQQKFDNFQYFYFNIEN